MGLEDGIITLRSGHHIPGARVLDELTRCLDIYDTYYRDENRNQGSGPTTEAKAGNSIVHDVREPKAFHDEVRPIGDKQASETESEG